jgi:hypothetical protein
MNPVELCKQTMTSYSIREWHIVEKPFLKTITIYSNPVLWPEIIQKLETEIPGFKITALPYSEFKGKV